MMSKNTAGSSDHDMDDNGVIALFEYLFDPPGWMEKAECVSRELDFSDKEAVLDACWSCPVVKQCEQHATDHRLSSGIYGCRDLSEEEDD